MQVSIIVPIYNAQKYLPRCLDSLIHQTLNDIEMICVEDGSTDDSAAIVKRYAEMDGRIRVIQHSENQGVGKSWRDGVLAAGGKYVMFLSADDEMHLNACEALCDEMERRRVDMLHFGTEICYSGAATDQKKSELEAYLTPPEKGRISGKALLDSLFVKKIADHKVWNKIYRAKVVKEAYAEFPEIGPSVGQEMLALFLIGYFARSYECIPEKYYTYHEGVGMATAKTLSRRQIDYDVQSAEVPKAIEAFLQRHNAVNTYQESLDSAKEMLLHDMVSKVAASTLPDDQEYAFNGMVKAWGFPAVMGMLHTLFKDGKNGEPFLKNMLSFSCFKTAPRKVKKIGTYYFTIYNGGAQRVVAMLAELWVKMGYEVVLFTDVQPNPDDYAIPASVKRVILPDPRDKTFSAAKRIETLGQAVREEKIDLFITHGWASFFLMYDMLAVQQAGGLFYIHTHNVFSIPLLSSFRAALHNFYTQPLTYEQADGVIALSKTNEVYWKHFNQNVFTVKNPLTFDCESIPSNKLDGKTVLWLARIAKEKVPLEAMEIMAKVIDKVPDAKMLVVGSGDAALEAAVKKHCEELGIADKVKFCGFQYDVEPYYQQSDVFLCTSKFEGYPLTLTEAESHGLPLVTYDMPYLTILESRKGCMIVDQNDVDGAADCVIKLLENDELRKRMGREAKENAIEQCTADFPAMWKEIFASAEKPREAVTADPYAVMMARTMVQSVQIGIAPAFAEWENEKRQWGQQQTQSLRNELALIKGSRSYRIASMISRIGAKLHLRRKS